MNSLEQTWAAYSASPGEQTFEPFFEQSKRLVYTVCWRILGQADDAADAFQGTYARLLALASEPEPVGDVRGTVLRTAVREADALRKRRGRRGRKEIAMEVMPERADQGERADEAAAASERREQVEQIVAELPPDLALPVQLYYFHGMSQPEIATALAMPVSTVANRMKRGLAQLERPLRKAGLGEAVGALAAILTAEWLAPPAALSAGVVYASAAAGAATGTATGMAGAKSAGAALKLKLAASLAGAIAVAAIAVVLLKEQPPAVGPAPTQPAAVATAVPMAADVTPAVAPEAPAASPTPTPAAPARREVALRFIWEDSREPIRETTVTLRRFFDWQKLGDERVNTTTDADGRARASLPLNWRDASVAVHDRFAPDTAPFPVPDQDEAEVAVPRGGILIGTVYHDSRPVEGATVGVLNGLTTTTTAVDGTFELSGLRGGGEYRPFAVKDDLVTYRKPDDVEGVRVQGGQKNGPLALILEQVEGLSGQVVAAETGAPLAGATIAVQLEYERVITAKTDADGQYRLPGIGGRRVNVTAEAQGYARELRVVELSEDTPNALDFRLEPGSALDVEVVDRQGKPVEGADVRVRRGFNAEFEVARERSAAGGRARIEGLNRKETYVVTAHAQHLGYNSCESDTASWEAGATAARARVVIGPSEGNTSGEKQRAEPAVFSGQVTGPDGQPLEGATVAWGEGAFDRGGATRTDATGAYRLESMMDLAEPQTALTAWKEGFGLARKFDPIPGTRESPARIDLRLGEPHWLEVEVVDEADKPLENASGYLQEMVADHWYGLPEAIRRGQSDAEGMIRFDGLNAGEFELSLSMNGMSQTQQRFAVDQRHRLTLLAEGVLRGIVVNAETGEPVTAFTIINSPGERPTEPGLSVQNPDGAFEIANLSRTREHAIRIEAEGYAPAELKGLEAAAPNATAIEPLVVRLQPAAQLKGVVVDAASGAPLQEATVTYAVPKDRGGSGHFSVNWSAPGSEDHSFDHREQTFTGSDGAFALADIEPEQGLLFVQSPGFERRMIFPTVRADVTDAGGLLRIMLGRGQTIAGRLMLNEEPQANVPIRLNLPNIRKSARFTIDQGQLETRTDTQGAFLFGGLQSGDYQISALDRSWSFDLADGENKTLALDPEKEGEFTLTGRVLLGTGPVPGVGVNLSRVRKRVGGVFGVGGKPDMRATQYQTSADAEGRFRFASLPAGTYRLHGWRHDGGNHQEAYVEDIELNRDMERDLIFGSKHRVTARLLFDDGVSSETKQRYERAVIQATQHYYPTGNAEQIDNSAFERIRGGRIEFSGRFKGEYELQLQFNVGGTNISVLVDGKLKLDNLEGDQELEAIRVPPLPPQGQASLSGTVVDMKGNPLAGANVSLQDEQIPFSGVSDKQGRYRIENLRPGKYAVRVATGRQPDEETVLHEIREEVMIDGETTHDFIALPHYRVKGRIKAPPDFVQNIWQMTIKRIGGEALAQDNPLDIDERNDGNDGTRIPGHFEWTGRYLGEYELRIDVHSNDGRNQIFVPLTLDNLEGDQDLGDVPLPELGKLRVALHWEGGPPPAPPIPLNDDGAGGARRGRAQYPLSAVLLRDGDIKRQANFKLEPVEGAQNVEGIAPGRYDIMVWTYAYASDPPRVPLEVKADEPAVIEVMLRPRGILLGSADQRSLPRDFTFSRVTVRGPLGSPDEATRVVTPSAEPMTENELFMSGRDFIRRGMFMILDLARGEYEVTAEADGFQPATIRRHVTPGLLEEPPQIEMRGKP